MTLKSHIIINQVWSLLWKRPKMFLDIKGEKSTYKKIIVPQYFFCTFKYYIYIKHCFVYYFMSYVSRVCKSYVSLSFGFGSASPIRDSRR